MVWTKCRKGKVLIAKLAPNLNPRLVHESYTDLVVDPFDSEVPHGQQQLPIHMETGPWGNTGSSSSRINITIIKGTIVKQSMLLISTILLAGICGQGAERAACGDAGLAVLVGPP